MKKFQDLNADQQTLAIEESLRRVLHAVTDGGLRFNDLANGNDLQARIDDARKNLSDDDEASVWLWRARILDVCRGDLMKLAVMSARDAVYVEGETVISLADL